MNGDHPNYNIFEIRQNTEKSPGDMRRVAVSQTLVSSINKQTKVNGKVRKEFFFFRRRKFLKTIFCSRNLIKGTITSFVKILRMVLKMDRGGIQTGAIVLSNRQPLNSTILFLVTISLKSYFKS